jgi:hypothetical protein
VTHGAGQRPPGCQGRLQRLGGVVGELGCASTEPAHPRPVPRIDGRTHRQQIAPRGVGLIRRQVRRSLQHPRSGGPAVVQPGDVSTVFQRRRDLLVRSQRRCRQVPRTAIGPSGECVRERPVGALAVDKRGRRVESPGQVGIMPPQRSCTGAVQADQARLLRGRPVPQGLIVQTAEEQGQVLGCRCRRSEQETPGCARQRGCLRAGVGRAHGDILTALRRERRSSASVHPPPPPCQVYSPSRASIQAQLTPALALGSMDARSTSTISQPPHPSGSAASAASRSRSPSPGSRKRPRSTASL